MVLVAAVAVGASLFTLAPTTSAEEGTGDVKLAGSGVLRAAGTGFVHLRGAMDFRGSAQAGALVVHDYAGGALVDVQGYGQRIELPDGGVGYLGFHGTAHLRGWDVQVDRSDGGQFVPPARPPTWPAGAERVNGLPAQPWTETGVNVAVES
jgi:hypothetical protein